MKTSFLKLRLGRRKVLGSVALGLGASAASVLASVAANPAGGGTVRDRLWLFAVPANSDFPTVKRRSLMTPAEGAFYLGVPNVILVQASATEAKYGRFEPPFAQYAIGLRPLKRVVWPLVGSGGFTTPEERKEGIELTLKTPNFVGMMLDDFFTGQREGRRAALSVQELADIRQQLRASPKKLEIFVTLYVQHLDLPLEDYLELVDVVTLWTWKPEELANLGTNLQKAQKLAPHAKMMMGCYMVDFNKKTSMPIPAMQQQCEVGLKWLRQGRVEGLVFLSNTVMDVGYEAVDWTRDWIARTGQAPL
jgi:hypothetical protein